MHEIFLLVDFSVSLTCFVMSQQIIQRFVQKKSHKQKMVKKLKMKMFNITFLQDRPIEDM